MTITAIIIGINPEEILFTLKSFAETDKYIDEIVIVNSGKYFEINSSEYSNHGYPSIQIFDTERVGICAAFNHGIMMSKSEYIVYVNSGDELIMEGLISATRLISASIDVVASAVNIYSPTSDTYITWTGLDPKSRISQIHQQGTIYKKSLHATHGTYSSLYKCAMDTAFFESVRSSKANHEIAYNPIPVVKFYTGGISTKRKNQTVIEYSLIKILGSTSPTKALLRDLPMLFLKLFALKVKNIFS